LLKLAQACAILLSLRVAPKIGNILYALILSNLQTYFTARIGRKLVTILSSHHTSSVSLHYLVKCQCPTFWATLYMIMHVI